MQTNWNHDVSSLLAHVKLPRVCRIRQLFNHDHLASVRAALEAQLPKHVSDMDLSGKRVAITVGSRGINGLIEALETLISALKAKGADPFIVPAMGSHAEATAKGQRKYIEDLGITEEALKVKILSSMDTKVIGTLADGTPVYCDAYACQADAVIVINKVKPHANFKGEIESGLCKMMAIGLGKKDGASLMHALGYEVFPEKLQQFAAYMLQNMNILFGVAIVENAYDQPMICEVISPDNIIKREKELLAVAKDNMPRILTDSVDVLIVDQIGKNISGQGMDPNVTGRSGSSLKGGFNEALVDRIVVLSLTNETHGNFAGLGMSDISTIRVAQNLDFRATYVNEIVSRTIPPARLPFLTGDDKQAVQLAAYTCKAYPTGDIGIFHIKDTNHLEDVEVSGKILRHMRPEDYDFGDDKSPDWQDMRFSSGRLQAI